MKYLMYTNCGSQFEIKLTALIAITRYGQAIAKRLTHSQHLPYFLQIMHFIIQHIVTLPKYGHDELNIRRPYITDILRYA